MSDNILYEDIIGDMLIDTQSVALCLAMSSTMLTENALKELCSKKGYRAYYWSMLK